MQAALRYLRSLSNDISTNLLIFQTQKWFFSARTGSIEGAVDCAVGGDKRRPWQEDSEGRQNFSSPDHCSTGGSRLRSFRLFSILM